MAQPGDTPRTDGQGAPDQPHDDDLIGFASPAALQGRTRVVPPPPVEPTPLSEPEVEAAWPGQTPEPELDLFDPEPVTAGAPEAVAAPPVRSAPPVRPAPEPVPDWARETRVADHPAVGFARRQDQPAPIEGAMGVYSVYALILFAVPTFGVSAAIALMAVTGKAPPQDPVAASHFIFQQRTLWAGAVVALLGAILIAVGLGVFVLIALFIWLILRGAGGVLRLKAGLPIKRPRAWLF